MSSPVRKYGQVSWAESVGILATMVSLPAALLWRVVTTAYASYNQERSFKRIIGDSVLNHILRLDVPQLQVVFGTTTGTYNKWCKAAKLATTVDELGPDAKLLWIGPKRLERGGFLVPAGDFIMSFCRYVQLELEKQNIEVGFALLEYCAPIFHTIPIWFHLIPLLSAGTASLLPYPAPAVSARTQLSDGRRRQAPNLQLVGDSAGGNLILQVLSQMLHPREGVPDLRLPGPLRGAYLISPWTNLSADSQSHFENEGRDWLRHAGVKDWGAQVLAGVPEATARLRNRGVDALVGRVLVTAGGAELLRDDIVAFAEAFKKHHADVKLVVQKGGTHEDVLMDFAAKEEKTSAMASLSVEWLAAGFDAEPRA
ncbi:hypothetical protein K438DRAFT_1969785 [Mycena galopus ATCC 62051]|nr:hypothetical protein K438DRAFT_1969785 [Mycena galopus ATCC 62051]